MPDVHLVSADGLPRIDDDLETPELARTLQELGCDARIVAWTDTSVDWRAAPVTVVRSTWDYTGQRDRFCAWADATAMQTSLWNPAEVLRWNSHKGYLRDLVDAGVAVVPTRHLLAGTSDDPVAVAAAQGWDTALVKPAVSAGAKDTWVLQPGDDASARDARALAAGADVLVQPFLPQIATDGEWTVLVIDGEPLLARRKLPKPGDFRVQEHLGGSTAAVPLDDELASVGRAIVDAAMRLTGADLLYARVDLVRIDGALRLMELELVEPFFYLYEANEYRAVAEAILRRR